jgi:hypothetical protein
MFRRKLIALPQIQIIKASDACVYTQLNLSTNVIAASTMNQASDVFDNTYAIRK